MLLSNLPSLTSDKICLEYLATLDKKQTFNDTRNALIRYFIPSIGGDKISATKHIRATEQEVEAAFEFLKTVPLQQLADSPDWALITLEERDVSVTQITRIKHHLKNLVNWARVQGYLPFPRSPIPPGICDDIKVGVFAELNLRPATALLIFEQYQKTVLDLDAQSTINNAIVRYFVPATGGPIPFHKPALSSEVKAALKHLETIPLEYLNEAPNIVTPVLDALNILQTQQTRIRSALRDFINWARKEKYLPHPLSIAPWGGELTPTPLPMGVADDKLPTALDFYNSYCDYLQKNDKAGEIPSLQSIIIRYLVSSYGGASPSGKRATPAEIEAGINYLKNISIEQLQNAIKFIEPQFELLGVKESNRYTPRSRIKAWIDWINSQSDFGNVNINSPQQKKPIFNTFYTNGIRPPKQKPGMKLHENRSPVHRLCAKVFPDDYINKSLEKEINNYKAWRLSNDVRKGAIDNEEEQILQALGWLHRYEGVPLEQLSLECLISFCQLVFRAKDYPDFHSYLYEKEKGMQATRDQAKADIERIRRYLVFVGGHPDSQKKRVSLLIAVSKFIYRDLIGSDDIPNERDIPVIRRLLEIQVTLGKKAKSVTQTVSYHETSVSWQEAIAAMEKQRRRAEQVIIYIKKDNLKGYEEKHRPNTAVANELQKFLSIAFCLLVPSRSRTFYDLRINETWKEGILTENKFLSVADLKEQGVWEQVKAQVAFYIHHHADDYKTGKAMAPVLMNNGGWWVEVPNLRFTPHQCLYDYVRRWLEWGRYAEGPVGHNFFFRHAFSPRPLDAGAWGERIRRIFAHWTGVRVPPRTIRKMFSSAFPDHKESAALLLQHSEQIHDTDYDMRHSVEKMQPVIAANQQLIQDVLEKWTEINLESPE
ncbi:hypothetical protein NIES4074_65940 [Cylindrospermum sp. NIES-4074]|nr:hypothetical protein NIES4074_65940 [Cylindrospermum sp. NIES-4074]